MKMKVTATKDKRWPKEHKFIYVCKRCGVEQVVPSLYECTKAQKDEMRSNPCPKCRLKELLED